jgi:hypothetical protein
MTNKYPGRCMGEGSAGKVNGRWVVACAAHAEKLPKTRWMSPNTRHAIARMRVGYYA